MSFDERFNQLNCTIEQSHQARSANMERFRAEIDFAKSFAELFPEKKEKWQGLIIEALELFAKALAGHGPLDVKKTVAKAEEILEPIGKAAKEYTIHCCGHAHIDMNWMWPWQETVTDTIDTFSTVNQLMDEFPEFHFSQSQASTYFAMEQYCPEIFEAIKKRVKEGRWDVTASMWVEGDKNIVSGESLCRHLLYTRRYFKEKMGLEPEDVKIDWSCDTFGHARTLPSILTRGSVSRYYFCRTGPGPWLFKWRSLDGSEILAYNDKGGYNGTIDPGFMRYLFCEFVKQTGLKDFMYMYGVGDHGGGPTRRDLRKASEMRDWPIFPVVKLSTTDAFFTAIEKANPDLPVVEKDLNFTFEGCYTAQTNIKRANRISEIVLPEAETMAVIAKALDKMPYPSDLFFTGWRYALFNHFHDILPGSGVKATYEYSQGLFQEIQAMTAAVRTRALRRLATLVNTASAAKAKPSIMGSGYGDGLGAGSGDPSLPGGMTARNAGAPYAEPVLIYNQKPWKRSEMVYAKVWNKPVSDECVVARDQFGVEVRGQVVARGHYWGHEFATVAFPVDVPALGYKVYAIDNAPTPAEPGKASLTKCLLDGTETMIPEINEGGVLENEFLKVTIDHASGAIKSLIDKETHFEYVQPGELMGVIEAYQEIPHGMSSWIIGQIGEMVRLDKNGRLSITQRGPNRVAVKTEHTYRNSKIWVEIGLNSGSRMVDFKFNAYWVERGCPETGVPMLRVAFPININDGIATYEIPFGNQVRPQSPQEVPALKWADVSGKTVSGPQGLTLVNDSKYGHSCNNNVLRLTLIRSSYEPDRLPEVAEHEIKYAIVPHNGMCDVVKATKLGEEFNSPLAVVSAPVQEGKLPAEKSFIECMTRNVFVSAVKKAEDSDALIIRLYEIEGMDTIAQVRIADLAKAGAKAVETDVLERPLKQNSARMDDDVLNVRVPAYGQTTVKIG